MSEFIEELRALAKTRPADLTAVGVKRMVDHIEKLEAEIERLRKVHPRAFKLMAKGKPFIVIANDEPYFEAAYKLIRANEISIGRWNEADEEQFKKLTSGE